MVFIFGGVGSGREARVYTKLRLSAMKKGNAVVKGERMVEGKLLHREIKGSLPETVLLEQRSEGMEDESPACNW